MSLELQRETLALVAEGKLAPVDAARLLRKLPKEAAENRSELPEIAVVGMAGKFPDAPDLETFWKNLAGGRDSVREVPEHRWRGAEIPKGAFCRRGGFLDDIESFDPLFFDISPREAELMDPQQRLFLQEVSHALEDGGMTSEAVAGSRCGVFVGATPGDYKGMLRQLGHAPEAFTLVGTDEAILAARISYLLNLKGPSISINTACSSSLVALSLACESLVAGTCDLALAGGVAVYSTPEFHHGASRAGILAPDGICKTFDDAADGFVPGEAVGVVVLKRLSEAVKNGDRIHGVISAWGTNQDGRSNGITAPNAVSQTELIRSAYERFKIDPATIGYVEAHGTGTKLGDPIEITALTEAFGLDEQARGKIGIGSVKTNVGHTFAAAGVTGLIKLLLCLRYQQLPPSLHVQEENRHIDFAHSPFSVCRELREWTAGAGAMRRAALSSFGFSGTNAHVVVSEHPATPSVGGEVSSRPLLFCLSAKSPQALRRRAVDLRRWLDVAESCALEDLAYTLSARRNHYEHRWGWIATNREELLAGLSALSERDEGALRNIASQADGEEVSVLMKRCREGEMAKHDWRRLAQLYSGGAEMPWNEVNPKGRLIDLPSYPFEKERYWYAGVAGSIVEESAPSDSLAGQVRAFTDMIGALEEVSRPRLLRQLVEFGLVFDGVEEQSVTSVARSLGVLPSYDRLVRALFELLERSRFLSPNNGCFSITAAGQAALEKPCSDESDVLLQHASAHRYWPLVNACLTRLPEVLTGRVNITQVMFPGGSMKLVEPTYHGDPIRDYFNRELVARVLAELDRGERKEETLTILEVGAGTGGTTSEFVRRFEGRTNLLRYLYSDVSPSFIAHGEKEFGDGAPYMEFQVLDLSRPFDEQGLALGSVDIIFASNVVHAVPDVSVALRHLRQALRPGGALLLNEITATNDLTTLTFGLTPGWWSFVDAEKRIQHAPLLTPEAWEEALLAVGFEGVGMTGLPFPEDKFAQRLVVATADTQKRVVGEAKLKTTVVRELDSGAHSPAEDLEEAALRFVRERLGAIVKLDPARIEPDKTFETYGVDSLVVVEFTKSLEEVFGSLPSTLLFECLTCRQLGDYLVAEHRDTFESLWGESRDVAGKQESIAPDEPSIELLDQPVDRKAPLAHDEIAIVGVAGRYPESPDLESFWTNLREGRNCIREVPEDRWLWREHFDPDGSEGKAYSRWGGFLSDIKRFDPLFFNMAPREVAGIDPQERIFLETVWHAFENAGYSPFVSLEGKGRIGVFAGVMNSDYSQLAMEHQVKPGVIKNRAAFWSLANRVSYVFNFQGPSFAVDSACSSSLTAIHLACNSLRLGECELAVAGGVNLILHPSKYTELSRLGMLAKDDRCKAFGAEADGFVDGEGVGAVLLKPLSTALKDGDHIHGIIKGSAINAGGKTSGYTVPNPNAQADLLAQALKAAAVAPTDISYIEAHGTGTPLGDPIEVAALARIYGRFADQEASCALGSVKSNIGHLESAAGIAGLTKILLQLRYRELAPSLHCEELNPKIAFEGSPFFVNRKRSSWTRSEKPLRAAVSSFGAGGANAHLIVEEAPAVALQPGQPEGERLFIVSARTEADLARLLVRHQEFLEGFDEGQLANYCYTLQVGRPPQALTFARVVSSCDELRDVLATQLHRGTWDKCLRPSSRSGASDGGAEQSHRLMQLAQQWVDGRAVDWDALYRVRPRRIELPLYPFGGKEYWLPVEQTVQPPVEITRGDCETLLSSGSRILTITKDDCLVQDHRVKGEPVMPGVGYLALLQRVFGLDREGVQVNQLQWLMPLIVTRDVQISLEWEFDGAQTTFRFRDLEGRSLARGLLTRERSASRDPISAIPSRQQAMPRRFARGELDRLFSGIGIVYRSYFQTLRQAEVDAEGKASGTVEAEAGMESAWQDDSLHAGMLDGALQIVGCLLAGESRSMLPASMESFELYRPIGGEAKVLARQSGATRFDIDLLDNEKQICVSVRGLEVRELRDPVNELCYVPHWQPISGSSRESKVRSGQILVVLPPGMNRASFGDDVWGENENVKFLHVPAAGFSDDQMVIDAWQGVDGDAGTVSRLVFLAFPGEREDSVSGLRGAEEAGVVSLFWFLKTVVGSKLLAEGAEFQLVTQSVHSVFGTDVIYPWFAGVVGLCQSVAKEYPNYRWQFCDLEAGEVSAGDGSGSIRPNLRRVVEGWKEKDIAWRSGKAYQRCLVPVTLPPADRVVFRHEGVYLIAGGAGGIGFEFSKFLAKEYQARLIWLGRSEASRHEELFATIRSLGGEVAYEACDISDATAVTAAVQAAKLKFGAIHGVIHSAIILKDQSLASMDEATLREVLAVKTVGSLNLYHAVREFPLDFFLFFSSGQSFVANPGQGSYAAACVFKDAYARKMAREAAFPVKVVNWGYWGDVGIVSGEFYRRRMAERGIRSIRPEEGLEAVSRVLASNHFQVLPIQASQEAIKSMGGVPETRLVPVAALQQNPVTQREDVSVRPDHDLEKFVGAYGELESLGRLKLLNRLRELGVFEHQTQSFTLAELRARLQVGESHEALLAAAVEMLVRGNLVLKMNQAHCITSRINNGLLGQLVNVDGDIAKLAREYPSIQGFADLLSRCLAEFTEVLSGRRLATDVLFPGGRSDAVERIYHENPLADWCNGLCAATVLDAVRQLKDKKSGEPIRILEVGAGTGGTSKVLLRALREVSGEIEYLYTDLSPLFLKIGKDFAQEYPFVRVGALDVSSGAACKRWVGSVDIVVAANVLHATKDLRATLRNVKLMLRPGGLLVLNEITRRQDFTTLTFGMLDGWWATDGLRIEHSPLLDRERWRALCREEGFGEFSVINSSTAPQDLGQDVMVAVSDGWVWQSAGHDRDADCADSPIEIETKVTARASARPASRPGSTVGSAGDRGRKVHETVIGIVSEVLEIDPKELDPDVPHAEFGVDSILAVEMVNKIAAALSVELEVTDFFNYSTIRELSEHLVRKLGEVTESLEGQECGLIEDRDCEEGASVDVIQRLEVSGGDLEERILDVFSRVRSGQLDVDDAEALIDRLEAGEDEGAMKDLFNKRPER
jgi:polyketide synthase PksN